MRILKGSFVSSATTPTIGTSHLLISRFKMLITFSIGTDRIMKAKATTFNERGQCTDIPLAYGAPSLNRFD